MKYILALFASLAACGANAAVCTGNDLIEIPEMESAKDAFFEGRYQDFAEMMGPNFPGFADRAPTLFAPLANIVDDSYQSCVTILQRHEAPGFYQDLVVYYDDVVEGPVTLLLIGADFAGEFRFVEFTFDTSLSNVLDGLR